MLATILLRRKNVHTFFRRVELFPLLLVWFLSNITPSPAFVPPISIQQQKKEGIFIATATTTTTTTTTNTQSTALFAKKKAAASKKIQVKMLKNVPGTGQKGEIVQVTPAFFQNKLKMSQTAERISDEEVEKEMAEKNATLEQERQEASGVKEKLEETTIIFRRKAGPDGTTLFGGVGAKMIMEEIQNQLEDHAEFFNRKGVKIAAIMDSNGKKMRSDIKTTGNYSAQLSLTKEIGGKVFIVIEAED